MYCLRLLGFGFNKSTVFSDFLELGLAVSHEVALGRLLRQKGTGVILIAKSKKVYVDQTRRPAHLKDARNALKPPR